MTTPTPGVAQWFWRGERALPFPELRKLAAIRDGYRRLWERVLEDACLFAGVGIPFNLMSVSELEAVAGGGEAGSRA